MFFEKEKYFLKGKLNSVLFLFLKLKPPYKNFKKILLLPH